MSLLKKYRSNINFFSIQEDYINFDLMKKDYPDLQSCYIALAELDGLMELPKGTSYYFSDIHGQGDKFRHILHNKAGMIRRKIDETLPDLTNQEKVNLSKICFYPIASLKFFKKKMKTKQAYNTFLENQILNIAKLIQYTGSKTTRKTFREQVNVSEYSAVIQEFVSASNMDKVDSEKQLYQKQIIQRFFKCGLAENLVKEMVRILKQLLVYKYIINGDIPDRGRDTAEIIDMLKQYGQKYSNVVINWGNHDLLWMGAAAGSRELICEFIRIQLRYGNEAILENDYGIDLTELALFADKTYKVEPGKGFAVQNYKRTKERRYLESTLRKIQKAIAVILWKLEACRYDELKVEPFLNMLEKHDSNLYLRYNDKLHILNDQDLPTIDIKFPTKFTPSEKKIIDNLYKAIKNSSRFQDQMRYLADIGGLYHLEDGILSYHAIVPMNNDGSLKEMEILGQKYKGRELFETLTSLYKGAFTTTKPPQKILDLFYTGWKGADSWTYGKSSMQTFTRTFIDDKTTHKESKSAYYEVLSDENNSEKAVNNIIKDFTKSNKNNNIKIFNGHVPVKLQKGEKAVKADGKVICGDGGFSEAYGDLGFCLISTSKGLYLKKLGPGVSESDVVGNKNKDILPETLWSEIFPKRLCLKDSSVKKEIEEKKEALQKLIEIYEAENRTF